MLRAAAALLAAAPEALGHGAMQLPPAWMNPGGAFSKFLQPGWIIRPAVRCTRRRAAMWPRDREGEKEQEDRAHR